RCGPPTSRAAARAGAGARVEEWRAGARREPALREELLSMARREEKDSAAQHEERRVIQQHNRLKPEDYSALERQGVFIVGSARSGTTILSDCLNLSPEIYLLQEAFFFCNDLAGKFAGWDNYDFAATFNARHVGYGNPRDKGTYVPTAAAPASTPHEFLNRFRDKYRYLGEKVAFGPQPHYMGDDWESDFIAYQARYFYHSQYFVTARAPHEGLWSMHKLFPERPIAALFECWLRSLRTSLELYLAFPHTHLILLEWLDEMTVRRISDILQTDIPLPNDWVGRNHQSSALEADELVPVLQPYRDWCGECGDIYAELRREFSRETLQFDSKWHPREFVKMMNQRIGTLLDEVMRAAEPQANAA
ncbi:MAG: sulfotransferase, partial [Planctomycetia bacterium]|nr:sulfotransferase [Planctomycetia bacterium]